VLSTFFNFLVAILLFFLIYNTSFELEITISFHKHAGIDAIVFLKCKGFLTLRRDQLFLAIAKWGLASGRIVCSAATPLSRESTLTGERTWWRNRFESARQRRVATVMRSIGFYSCCALLEIKVSFKAKRCQTLKRCEIKLFLTIDHWLFFTICL